MQSIRSRLRECIRSIMEPTCSVRGREVDRGELFFLIARYLDGGPCQETARVLRQELATKGLLPKRKNWLGEDVPLSYEQAVSAAPHVSTDHLAHICSSLQELLRSHDHLHPPSLNSLLGSHITAHITHTPNTTTCGGGTVLHCVSQLQELTAATRRQPVVNNCQLLCARAITPSFSSSFFTGPNLYRDFKQHCAMLGHLAPVYCVMFDKTGQRVITGADDDLLKVWSSDQGQLLATLRGHAAEVTDISLSPDNTMIASGSLDKTVRVWCAQSSATTTVLTGHTGHITSVQFSPCLDEEQRLLASTTKDGFVYFWLWNSEAGSFYTTPIKYMEKDRVGDQTLCSAFSPGGKYFATGGTDRIVRVYSCIPGPPTLTAEVSGHMDRIMTIQFCHSTDSVFATGSCDATGRIWRFREGAWQGKPLLVHPQEIAKMTTDWGKDKPQVTMIGWECTDTYVITAFSPDCHLRVYQASSCSLIHTLKAHKGEVFVVESHPSDSRVLLSAGHDGLIALWDLMSGVMIKSFQMAHEGEQGVSCIFDCRFSPDGTLCAAADGSGYLSLLGRGSSLPYQQPPEEQFFHTDYRPLMRDRNHFVVDEQTQQPPHLLPPPYLVDIDGHAHPARHQEALLRQMRPVKEVQPDSGGDVDVVEDYDEVMRQRLNKIKLEGAQFRSARSAMAQREGAGGREREGEGAGGREREGEGAGGREREGERADSSLNGGQNIINGVEAEETAESSRVVSMETDQQGDESGVSEQQMNGDIGPSPPPPEEPQNPKTQNGTPPPEEQNPEPQNGTPPPPPEEPQQHGGAPPLPPEEPQQHSSAPLHPPLEEPQQHIGAPPPPPEEPQQHIGAPPPPPEEPQQHIGAPPPPPEEPTVDVTTQQGGGQSIQNMLSSVIYSLGLTEEEASQYLSHWHSRTVIPPLDSPTLAWLEARWRDLYQREQLTFDEESKKLVVTTPLSPVPVATEGRSLRSGRTLPDPSEPPDPVLVEREGGSEGGSEPEDEGELWVDNESTASSDISDWTREEGIGFLSPARRKRRLRKKRASTSEESRTSLEVEDEEEEENEEGGEEDGETREEGGGKAQRPREAAERGEKERKKKKARKPPPVRSVCDYTAYLPPDWLKATSLHPSPYFPQVGDLVVYFHQGHELYMKAVKEEKLCPWKPQKMPWQRYHLKPQELCQVKNVHFVVGPPTLCSISLVLLTPHTFDGPGTSKTSSEKITFTFKYHDMDNVLEFLVLESVYKKSVGRAWPVGSRFRSKIDGMYWYGVVRREEPFSPDTPGSQWQCYRVEWDDGATDQLSPWDMEPLRGGEEEEEEEGEGDGEGGWLEEEGEGLRILRGLEVVAGLDEAAMFLEPVDLEEVVDYCTRVPFPTDLSTIRTRLQNKFYRRKIALLWEVVQMRRNAELYNEERSLIVSHARILVNTLCRFISSSSHDPLAFYREEEGGEGGGEVEDVPVPEVEYVDNGILPPTLSPTSHPHTSPPPPSSSSSEEYEERESTKSTNTAPQPWCCHAEELMEELRANENSSPFLHPVDTSIYSDYCDVIRKPMDLSKISRKLRNGHYIIPNDIITDIRLIFSNGKTYNAKGTMVYRMTTELQSFFESILLNFLKSCGGQSADIPLHGTRNTLGRLAHNLSSDDVATAMQTASITTLIEAHPPPRRSGRQRKTRKNLQTVDSEDEDSESEQSSAAVSPLTPASGSSVLTVQSGVGEGGRGRRGRGEEGERESHGMTLRERNPIVKPVKRVLEDSESEEEEEEGEGGGRRVKVRTRSWASAHKRQRFSSDSEGEEGVAMVTRTSRGRVVKPIHKFS